MPMLLTITLILLGLVTINLLLLKFSCNKIVKPSKNTRKPVVLRPHNNIEASEAALAPTGS